MAVSWSSWRLPIHKSSTHRNMNVISKTKIKNKQKANVINSFYGEAATLELSKDFVRQKSQSEASVMKATTTGAVLKPGSKNAEVKKLQKKLNTLGYNTGKPDGIYGNGTKAAVTKFQKLYGISADGIAGNTTQAAINTTLTRQNKGILSRGQISNNVKSLQKKLKTLGFLTGNADGEFGAGTESAVKAFQKKYNLSQDGLAGSATRSKIDEILKKQSTQPVTPGKVGAVSKVDNGAILTTPKPGDVISVSLGTDKANVNAKVTSSNAWSIEYSIQGCKNAYGENALCTKRLKSAISQFSYNKNQADLLKLNVPGYGTCYAGAMVDGFGKIGDIAEVTLDNGEKFNFMILDTKSTSHTSAQLAPNNQCQNKYGHGYMLNNNKDVQLSICEFITSQSSKGISSAKNYPSGNFLKGRYVTKAKIIAHANID